jgi:hypothetical protein
VLSNISVGSIARRTIQGYETIHKIRKGEVRRLRKGDVRVENQFIDRLFFFRPPGRRNR